ncbi:MAG: cysteine dioxygenase [Sporichthyaceae bacterium]
MPVPTLHSPVPTPLGLADLTGLVREIGAAEDFWRPSLELPEVSARWWRRIWHDPDVDVWLLSWLPGHVTELHDHGDSAAAFTVVRGELTETRVDAGARVRHRRLPGETTWLAPGVVHDVHGAGDGVAVSVHAYSPPLTRMNYYDAAGTRVLRSVVSDEPEQELSR